MSPLPYMGSKRDSAGKIYQTIKNFNPSGKILCDLFCGGFAISEYFLKNGWEVIANDANKYIVAILDRAINNKLDEDKYLEWVSRAKFEDVLKNPQNYEDWYVGYLMSCWSFGNQHGKGYLFGREIEHIKRAGHELVVYKNFDLVKKLFSKLPQKYIDGILRQKDWKTRRLALLKVVNSVLKTSTLERLEQLGRLQQLQQLAQLERLQQLEQLKKEIQFFAGDYRKVEIPKHAVIYCDPPYANTAEYAQNNFNHVQFWDWVRGKSKTHNVYISEYTAPPDFKAILKFGRRSILSATNNNKQSIECLFTMIK